MDRASEFFPVPEKTALTPEKSDPTRQMLDDVKREFAEELKAIMGDRASGQDAAELKAVVSEVITTAYSDARVSRWSDKPLSKAITRYDTDVIGNGCKARSLDGRMVVGITGRSTARRRPFGAAGRLR